MIKKIIEFLHKLQRSREEECLEKRKIMFKKESFKLIEKDYSKNYPFIHTDYPQEKSYYYHISFILNTNRVNIITDILNNYNYNWSVNFLKKDNIKKYEPCINAEVLNNKKNITTIFAHENEAGISFIIHTNDIKLLEELSNLDIELPSPQEIFGNQQEAEKNYGYKNGLIIWFNSNWYFFWESLSKEQKKEYIKKHKLSKDWQNFLELWELDAGIDFN